MITRTQLSLAVALSLTVTSTWLPQKPRFAKCGALLTERH
mgnify:CR=1 FL=1